MFYEQLLRQYSFARRIQSQTVSTKKLLKTFLYEKVGHKMLMKLTQGYIGELGGPKNQNRYFVIYGQHLKAF